MKAIYKREMKAYFTNVTGFVFIAFFLVIIGVFATIINFSYASPGFENVLTSVSFLFLVIVPILTMRTFSEERRQKTDQLLYSLPISMSGVVLGKYLATLTVFAIPTALSCVYPLVLSLYDPSGYISYFTTYGTILAFFLLGAALMAIGVFVSSLTESQIIAAVLCFVAVLFSYLMPSIVGMLPTSVNASFVGLIVIILIICAITNFLTKNATASWLIFIVLDVPLIIVRFVKSELLEGTLTTIFEKVSLFDKFYTFSEGSFDVTSIIYFLTIIVLFLFFTVESMEKRRWS